MNLPGRPLIEDFPHDFGLRASAGKLDGGEDLVRPARDLAAEVEQVVGHGLGRPCLVLGDGEIRELGRPPKEELGLPQLRQSIVISPLGDGARGDAEEVGKLGVFLDPEPVTSDALGDVHTRSLVRYPLLSSPLNGVRTTLTRMGKSTTFAARMAMAVKETGKSLQAIADEAGTSKGQVSQWQTEGKVQPESVKADVAERMLARAARRAR